MPEIKHTFTGAKMNKDLDERLVPNGEYREAMNVQIRTTDSDDTGVGSAGVVQNLQGNIEVASVYDTNSVCVGSVADEKNDKGYFLFGTKSTFKSVTASTPSSETLLIDTIVEVGSDSGPQNVLVDVWGIVNTATLVFAGTSAPNGSTTAFTTFTVNSSVGARLRDDMTIRAVQVGVSSSTILFSGVKIKSISADNTTITLYEPSSINWTTATYFMFEAQRVLNFCDFDGNPNYITGINIIDNLLFWTDNYSEPKKINIDRCKEGTTAEDSHTKLYIKNPLVADSDDSNYQIVSELEDFNTNDYIREEHVTVIRKAPKYPPTIHVGERNNDFIEVAISANIATEQGSGAIYVPPPGAILSFTNEGFLNANYLPGDILVFKNQDDDSIEFSTSFNSYQDNNAIDDDNLGEVQYPTSTINVTMIETVGDIQPGSQTYIIEVDRVKKTPLFELRFPRFGYRYKYEDGEYSTFSPWSEVAFVPSAFDYSPKKGYNLGMVNSIAELKIKDFIPLATERPLDVAAVDILFKTTDSPNVYVIKTITRGKDPEWDLFTPTSENGLSLLTGELLITSEMVHAALPSNQTLRAWDNVPRKALAQEITANRLLYGNYTQGFNIKNRVNLSQTIDSLSTATVNYPKKSIKTIRDYKFGLVFGDKYGRETPVVASGYTSGSGVDYVSSTGGTLVEKNLCALANSFKLKQDWDNTDPDSWIDYVKYYVRETTNEYYNLVMDRWYYAEDKDNLWISFPSADRNKVDEETYLLLKNQHGSNLPVLEKARYKIIAIENEAPDFVKIDYRTLGELEINTPDLFDPVNFSFTSNANQPNAIMSLTDITISNLNYKGFFDNYMQKGKLTFRIVGRTYDANQAVVQTLGNNDDFVTVNHYTTEGDGAQTLHIHFEKAFSEIADMRSRFISQFGADLGGGTLRYFVEFREEIVENKPEFDGRFFVLIEKDDVIEEAVEKISDVAVEWVETADQIDISYIDSQQYNPALQGPMALTTATWYNLFSAEGGAAANYFALGAVQTGGETGDQTITDSSGQTVHNYGQRTKDFWQAHGSQGAGANKVFLDGARATKFQIEEVGEDYWLTNNNGGSSTESIYNFKPNVFLNGGANEGTYGVMTISQQTKNAATIEAGNWSGGEGATILLNKLKSGNHYFKWEGDTSGNVYKILADATPNPGNPQEVLYKSHANSMGGTDGAHVYNFGNDESSSYVWEDGDPTSGVIISYVDSSGNTVTESVQAGNPTDNDNGVCGNCTYVSSSGGASQQNTLCRRVTIRVHVRRVDESGNVTNDGLLLNEFDPRGQLKHDGSTALKMIFLNKLTSSGSIVVPENDRAVFETEPKKSPDLELYYEASPALPMKLRRENALSFIPLNVPISIKNTQNSIFDFVNIGSLVNGGEDINGYTDHKVSNISYTNEGPVILISSTNSSGVTAAHTRNIGIGDYVLFNHHSGLKTMTKIEDHYVLSGTVYVPQTSYSTTITLDGNATDEYPQGTLSVTSGGGFTEATDLVVGMNVTGANVPSGVFVTVAEPGTAVSLNDTSWMTFGVGESVTLTSPTGWYKIDPDVYKYEVNLGWFNCWSFGNGVESDRIRDDFNAPQLDNGVKVSSTFTDYKKETKGSGIIYSGLYNSTSGVNDLNEFNMAEKITKDLNPAYGSIQAMKTRDRDVVVFTEDKVLKVLSNKDAVYNADGNPQLISTNRVLGEAQPFVGDYGISKNPESLAWDQYRMYFADKQRGSVLRLSRDGLTPISKVGMSSWFRTNLKNAKRILGTFDKVNGEYNLTLDGETNNDNDDYTVSFNEASKGWISFKSFIPENGVSFSGKYFTTKGEKVYRHYDDTVDRNTFYGATELTPSSITFLFNDVVSSVKSFKTINYEGTQARVIGKDINSTQTDGQYYNLEDKSGWWVENFKTDSQEGMIYEFINKENKWFNRIRGITKDINNLDTKEFTVQGIGNPSTINSDTGVITPTTPSVTPDTPVIPEGESNEVSSFTLTIQNDPDS